MLGKILLFFLLSLSRGENLVNEAYKLSTGAVRILDEQINDLNINQEKIFEEFRWSNNGSCTLMSSLNLEDICDSESMTDFWRQYMEAPSGISETQNRTINELTETQDKIIKGLVHWAEGMVILIREIQESESAFTEYLRLAALQGPNQTCITKPYYEHELFCAMPISNHDLVMEYWKPKHEEPPLDPSYLYISLVVLAFAILPLVAPLEINAMSPLKRVS